MTVFANPTSDAVRPAGASPSPRPSRGSLEGLTVIDLTMMLAGPFCTMMLADQGADVIKVEPPGGDDTRRIGPHLEGALTKEEGGYGAYFASINRNKRSIVLNLKSPEGRQALLDLVEKADLLVENYRFGVLERLKLTTEVLHERNPKLVHVSIRGFGDETGGLSPYVHWPAYDPVSQAMGGIMGVTSSTRGGTPSKVGPGIGDIAPAMFAAFGAVSACLHAQRTGEGQHVDVAMVDSVLAVCERIVFQYSATGESPGPEGSGHPLLCPFGLFPAADGFITLGIPKDRFWVSFAEAIGQPELASDPRFVTNADRLENAEVTEATVSEWTGARTRAEIAAVLGGVVPFAPVMTAEDIFADPHFSARNMLGQVAMPGADQPLTVAGSPVHMSRSRPGPLLPAPKTGEHTEAILRQFDFSDERIARLSAATTN